MSLTSILFTAVLPVIAIGAVGFVLGRVKDIEVGPLNVVTVYVLIPALIFYSLATTTLGGGTIARVIGGTFLLFGGLAGISEVVGRVLDQDSELRGAFVLASTFPNSGNLGIPLCAFVFGAVGRNTAVLFLVGQSVVSYTFGAYVASRSGGSAGLSGVKEILGVPLIYAVAAAGLLRWADLVPATGSAVMEVIELTGNASIPVMLLMLGIELSDVNATAAMRHVAAANVTKLVVSPLVAIGIVLAIGLTNSIPGKVFVLEAATPAAVTALVLILEFGGEGSGDISTSEFVSATVFTSTLLSIPVLTVLIAILQSGFLV
ncbi:AEC family transporter [Halospeciosus flavus]|uniref:AEC family transporter n=1 Tax=Halospeciosus flavus TaxID=3032283 RepID=A0ABD5Z8X1_9EURY|nr:AEC family transporter [Halospeciosus flavus]